MYIQGGGEAIPVVPLRSGFPTEVRPAVRLMGLRKRPGEILVYHGTGAPQVVAIRQHRDAASAAGDDQLWTISEVKDRAKRAPAKKAEEPIVEAAPVVESAPAEEAKPEVKEEPVVEEKPVEEPAKAEEKPAEPVKAEEVKAEPVKAAAPAAKAPAKKPVAKKTSRAARKKAAAAKK